VIFFGTGGRAFGSFLALGEQFWGHLPEARGRRALSTEFWRLGQALRDVGVDVERAFRVI
jgi:hypothetical protein